MLGVQPTVVGLVGIRECGLFVGEWTCFLYEGELGVVNDGEEYISVECGMYLGNFQDVDEWKQLLIYGGSSDDVRHLLIGHKVQHFSHAGRHLRSLNERGWGVREHNVTSPREGFARQREISVPSHDNGVSHRYGFKPFEIGREVPQEVVIFTYGAVFGHCHYESEVWASGL